MKTTIRDDFTVDEYLNQLELFDQNTLKRYIDMMMEYTHLKPSIWGKDIIGFGQTTYSNTYLKDQPYFRFGLRKTAKGYTLYLTAYDQQLYDIADKYHIKHGAGCFYLKNDHLHLEGFQQLILKTLNS